MDEKTKKRETNKTSNELKRVNRRKQWFEASKDPEFLKDLADIESDFRVADFDNLAIVD